MLQQFFCEPSHEQRVKVLPTTIWPSNERYDATYVNTKYNDLRCLPE